MTMEKELPEGWVNSDLTDICTVKTGKVDANHAKEMGKYTFFTCALEPLKADTFSFEGELIILPGNGANVGHVGYFKGKIEAYQRTYVLHNFPIVPRYVYWHLSRNWKAENEEKQFGSATNYIKMGNFEDYSLPLPPLAEQQVIADKLDALLAQVATTKTRLERVPETIKRFRQSVLAAAVSGKLTEEWNVSLSLLSDISEFQNGFAFKSGWFEKTGKYQVIKLGNIRDGALLLSNSPAYVSGETAEEFKKFSPNNGDILLSMTGTRFKQDYGFGCLVSEEKDLLINQRVGRIIPNRSMVIPAYLMIYIRSELFRRQFFKGETGGVNQGNVGSKHIMSISVDLPSLEVQAEIVRRVEELFAHADAVEQQAKAALEKVNNLTQSILAKAFRGELTADWRAANPELISGENSAEALLERIKEERAAQKPKKRATTRRKKKVVSD